MNSKCQISMILKAFTNSLKKTITNVWFHRARHQPNFPKILMHLSYQYPLKKTLKSSMSSLPTSSSQICRAAAQKTRTQTTFCPMTATVTSMRTKLAKIPSQTQTKIKSHLQKFCSNLICIGEFSSIPIFISLNMKSMNCNEAKSNKYDKWKEQTVSCKKSAHTEKVYLKIHFYHWKFYISI